MHADIRRALVEGRRTISWPTHEGRLEMTERSTVYLKLNNEETNSGNKSLVTFPNGVQILYSYGVPVAGRDEFGLFKTLRGWSSTTTRHINTWTEKVSGIREVSQETLNKFSRLGGC